MKTVFLINVRSGASQVLSANRWKKMEASLRKQGWRLWQESQPAVGNR